MSTIEEFAVKSLQSFPQFSSVPEEDLLWLVQNSKVCTYMADELMIEPGSEINKMYMILDGAVRVRLPQGNSFANIGDFETGDITGVLPFSRMQSTVAHLVVVEDTTVLETNKDLFVEITKRYKLIEAFVHSLSDRVRSFTSLQQQNEKLVALGKLSAGLAHELNNPASAMVRSAASLRARIAHTPEKFKAVMNIRLTNDQVDAVNELVFRKAGKGSSNQQSLMERTALEDDLTDWMEDHGVDNGFEFSETFAEFCFNIQDLEFVASHVSEEYLPAVLGWVEDVLTTEKMVEEIEDSATRISDLVSSVKTYSHMDRGTDKEAVELKKVLKSTVTMLNHKAKQKNIEIELDIPADLPTFYGFVSELNQVWTNLLDNAIDAVENEGKIEVKAVARNKNLLLYFKDNGSGIPEDVVNKIFDPFFTTKDVGEGTGLGLDVVHKILERHGATVDVKSKPGETEFELCFPLD
jgi:signal transduction histidine kinase